jgi:hypothetical protein
VTIVNGQYSFVDEEQLILYTITSSTAAQINIETGNPVFLQKIRLGTGVVQGLAFNSKARVLYGVVSKTLNQYSLDEELNATVLSTTFPSLSSSAMATTDPNNDNYVVLQSNGFSQ